MNEDTEPQGASSAPQRDPTLHLKALVSGLSGAGKSAMSVTMPGPALVLLSETQGRTTIAKRSRELGVPMPDILQVTKLEDYRCVVRAFHTHTGDGPFRILRKDGSLLKELAAKPRSVSVDSITDACELVYEEIKEDAPLKQGEDGLPVFTQRHWTELEARCARLFRVFRDLEAHVLFLAILEERVTETSDGKSTRLIGPQLPQRRLPAKLMQCTNVAGILSRSARRDPENPNGDRVLTWEVQTIGPSDVMVKPFRPLPDFAPPDFDAWVRACLYDEHVESTRAGDRDREEEAPNTTGRRRRSKENV
jgi:hypothetical protein